MVAGEQTQVTRVGELVYPQGMTPASPEELGKLLGDFLREKQFTARQAVVGLPARWLVFRTKEVPPADPETATGLLRLAAEGEFPSDIKDLVYDFAGEAGGSQTRTVLLVATPQKHVEAAVALCESARLEAVAVTSSAAALGEATDRLVSKDALVLAVGPSGAEMSAQSGNVASAIRHLRAPTPQPAFVSDLRRALLTLSNGRPGRELIVWDGAGLDSSYLGDNLGVAVRKGDLPLLGVSAPATSANGEGRKYAAAVALGLAGIGRGEQSVDFLHPRLAPPKPQRIPQWAILAITAAVVLIACCVWGYVHLHSLESEHDSLQATLDQEKTEITTASTFVAKVQFAQAWYAANPRYLACLRDLTTAMPEDNVTYATSVVLREVVHAPSGQAASNASVALKQLQGDTRALSAQLFGKTSDQERVQALQDRMQHVPTFSKVEVVNSNANTREHDVSFQITWIYTPPKPAQ